MPWKRWQLALLMIAAGLNHFVSPEVYQRIVPDYVAASLHSPAVFWSEVAEVVLGVLLVVPRTQQWAAWGIIAVLIKVLPANIHAWQHSEELFWHQQVRTLHLPATSSACHFKPYSSPGLGGSLEMAKSRFWDSDWIQAAKY